MSSEFQDCVQFRFVAHWACSAVCSLMYVLLVGLQCSGTRLFVFNALLSFRFIYSSSSGDDECLPVGPTVTSETGPTMLSWLKRSF